MNELIMTGYVATEPEINEFKRKRRRNKKTPQYGLAANFRISVKRSFKKKDGKKYDYFSCSAFDKSAEYIEEYIEEGDYIGIHGTLLNDNYENDDGDMVYKDKITVLRIDCLENEMTKRKDMITRKSQRTTIMMMKNMKKTTTRMTMKMMRMKKRNWRKKSTKRKKKDIAEV